MPRISVHDRTYWQEMARFGPLVIGTSLAGWGYFKLKAPQLRTMTPEWRAATEEYKRFQNIEPMGLRNEAYTPSYMRKPSPKKEEAEE